MLKLNFDPFPVLQTERLVIRKISMNDAADMYMLRSKTETMQYISRPLLHSIAEAQNLIGSFQDGVRNRANIVWGISLADQSELIGTIGYHRIEKDNFRAEIGYLLREDFWGKGYASEALSKVLDYGFEEMGLHSIEARIDPRNTGSGKLLLKHHFVKEAYFKENSFFAGAFFSTEVYSLIRASSDS